MATDIITVPRTVESLLLMVLLLLRIEEIGIAVSLCVIRILRSSELKNS